jgi:hypothetical protein
MLLSLASLLVTLPLLFAPSPAQLDTRSGVTAK